MFFSKIFSFIFSVLLLNPLPDAGYGPDSCLLYKKGKFVRHVQSARNGKPFVYDVYMERNDTTERFYCRELLRDTVVHRIRWISDCTYERMAGPAARNAVISCFSVEEKNTPQTITIAPAGKYYLQQKGTSSDTIWVKELWITLSEED